MSQKNKGKYLTKEIRFGKSKVTLYSLDGLTWSSRRDELAEIKARHERDKVTYDNIKGIAPEEAPIEEKVEASSDEPVEIVVDDEEVPRKFKSGKGKRPAANVAPADDKKAKKSKPPVNKPTLVPVGAAKGKREKAPLASPKKRESSMPARNSAKGKAKRKAA